MSQEKSTRLYLLRHGPAAISPGCLVGSTDAPLSGQGLVRLSGLIEPYLQSVECWYCSPMLRASQTFDCLRQYGCSIEHPVYSDERLREIDFGNWEMKTFAEIAAADPAKVTAWQEYTNFVFPSGEAVADFVLRVREMLEVLTAASGSVGVVTHGGVIRTMICMVLGLPVQNYLLFDVQPASLTILDLFAGGSGVLRGLNL